MMSCYDVPEWARVKRVNVEFDTEGPLAKIKYTRQRGRNIEVLEDYTENSSF